MYPVSNCIRLELMVFIWKYLVIFSRFASSKKIFTFNIWPRANVCTIKHFNASNTYWLLYSRTGIISMFRGFRKPRKHVYLYTQFSLSSCINKLYFLDTFWNVKAHLNFAAKPYRENKDFTDSIWNPKGSFSKRYTAHKNWGTKKVSEKFLVIFKRLYHSEKLLMSVDHLRVKQKFFFGLFFFLNNDLKLDTPCC